jgi:hypothetical protein
VRTLRRVLSACSGVPARNPYPDRNPHTVTQVLAERELTSAMVEIDALRAEAHTARKLAAAREEALAALQHLSSLTPPRESKPTTPVMPSGTAGVLRGSSLLRIFTGGAEVEVGGESGGGGGEARAEPHARAAVDTQGLRRMEAAMVDSAAAAQGRELELSTAKVRANTFC